MLGSHRFAKTIATSLCAALAAYAVAVGLAEKDAHAQISGTIGGDAVGRQPPEGEGIFDEEVFFEAPPSGSVLVTAEEIAKAWMDGTSNTIMAGYTIFLVDYTDDACTVAGGDAPSDAALRVCAFVSQRFRAFMQERRLAVSPRAVMAQTPDGIAIWVPR